MGLFNPGAGYKKAQHELDKYYGEAQGVLDPYNRRGASQYKNLDSYIQSLMDPAALQDQWSQGYETSGSAQNAMDRAQQHGLDAASSMGLLGSQPALNAIQAGTAQIGMDDRQNYLDSLMQKYMAGAGLSQNIYGIGANAAGQMGQNAMNMGQNSAQMAYGRENAGGDMISGLIGAGLGGIGSAMAAPIGQGLVRRWNLSGGA